MFPLFFAIGWRSHSVFAVNQGIWVALFMTGTSDTAGDITLDHFQPTLDLILAREVTKLYSGQWSTTRGDSEIVLGVDDGSLWLTKLVLNGTDVLCTSRSRHHGRAEEANAHHVVVYRKTSRIRVS